MVTMTLATPSASSTRTICGTVMPLAGRWPPVMATAELYSSL